MMVDTGTCAVPRKRSPRTPRSAAAIATVSSTLGRPMKPGHQAEATISSSPDAAICPAKKALQAIVTLRV